MAEWDDITIEVKRDYDSFFEGFVREMLLNKGGGFKHRKFIINAGPYRPYAVDIREPDKDTLTFDFYSAYRHGFGSISKEELRQIFDML